MTNRSTNQKALMFLIAILSAIAATHADYFAECDVAGDSRNFVASDKSCSHFIFCDGDNSYDGECGEGDYFNEMYQTCDPKDLVECRIAGEQPEIVDVGVNNNMPTIITPDTNTINQNNNNINNNNNNNNNNNPNGIVAPPLPQVPTAISVINLNTTTTSSTLTVNNSNTNTNFTNSIITTNITTPIITTPNNTTPINTTPNITIPNNTTPIITTANITTPIITTPVITNPVITGPIIVSPPILLTKCPAVDNPQNVVFLAHPKSCSEYFICYHGEPISMHCSSMLHFDVKSGKCDHPENAKCKTEFSRDQCQTHTVDLYPHPSNCNYFYYCKNGYLLLQQCPFFSGWDYERRACVALAQAKCYNNYNQKRL